MSTSADVMLQLRHLLHAISLAHTLTLTLAHNHTHIHIHITA